MAVQSKNCCAESAMSLPVAIFHADSKAPAAEKAQHAPHAAWYLTGVTAPARTQFSDGGAGVEVEDVVGLGAVAAAVA